MMSETSLRYSGNIIMIACRMRKFLFGKLSLQISKHVSAKQKFFSSKNSLGQNAFFIMLISAKMMRKFYHQVFAPLSSNNEDDDIKIFIKSWIIDSSYIIKQLILKFAIPLTKKTIDKFSTLFLVKMSQIDRSLSIQWLS